MPQLDGRKPENPLLPVGPRGWRVTVIKLRLGDEDGSACSMRALGEKRRILETQDDGNPTKLPTDLRRIHGLVPKLAGLQLNGDSSAPRLLV